MVTKFLRNWINLLVNQMVLPRLSIATYSRRRYNFSHRILVDGFSTEDVGIMVKLPEGIRSVIIRIYQGLVIVGERCANLINFMGLFLVGKNSLKGLIISCGAILDGQPKDATDDLRKGWLLGTVNRLSHTLQQSLIPRRQSAPIVFQLRSHDS